MTAGADRGINDRLPRRRGQSVQYLGRKHRPVTRFARGVQNSAPFEYGSTMITTGPPDASAAREPVGKSRRGARPTLSGFGKWGFPRP